MRMGSHDTPGWNYIAEWTAAILETQQVQAPRLIDASSCIPTPRDWFREDNDISDSRQTTLMFSIAPYTIRTANAWRWRLM